MAEKSFRHVTSGAYAKKGPVFESPLGGHLALNPLGFGTVRIVKGRQVYTNESAYKNAEAVRSKFAAAFTGKKGNESLAKKASAACAGVAPGNRGRCFVGKLASIGRDML